MAQLIPLDKLINTAEFALPFVIESLKDQVHAFVPVAQQEDGNRELFNLQVTTRSPMGAIAYSQAGIFLQHGFVRILGAGRHKDIQRSIVSWTQGKFQSAELTTKDGATAVRPGAILIADDVLGGSFALNGGGIDGVELGHVAYYCPTQLIWDDLGFGYSAFIEVMGSPENFLSFYQDVLWNGWEGEVAKVHGDQALSVYPPLWAASSKGPTERSRKAVPVEEVYSMLHDADTVATVRSEA
jgi:hypothetical protein